MTGGAAGNLEAAGVCLGAVFAGPGAGESCVTGFAAAWQRAGGPAATKWCLTTPGCSSNPAAFDVLLAPAPAPAVAAIGAVVPSPEENPPAALVFCTGTVLSGARPSMGVYTGQVIATHCLGRW